MSRLTRIDERLAVVAMQHSMSEPVSGSDRVKRSDRVRRAHLVKTIVECRPGLTRSLPLLGSDVEWQ